MQTRRNRKMSLARLGLLIAVVGVAIFGLSVLTNWHWGRVSTQQLQQSTAKMATKNIDNILQKLEIEHLNTLSQIEGHQRVSRSAIRKGKEFQFFIYISGQLFFWSDYRFVPDYSDLIGDFEYKCITTRNGYFIARRTAVLSKGRLIEVYTLLPIYNRYQISNKYLNDEWNRTVFGRGSPRGISLSSEVGEPVYYRDKYLFSLVGGVQFEQSSVSQQFSFYVGIAGYLLVILGLGFFMLERAKSGLSYWAYWLYPLCIAGFRVIMYALGFPEVWGNFSFFDPRKYASAWLAPSPGDLLLNIVAVLGWLLVLFYLGPRNPLSTLLSRLRPRARFVSAAIMAFLAMAVVVVFYQLMYSFYVDGKWDFDLTSSLHFSSVRLLAYSMYTLTFVAAFLSVHFLTLSIIRLVGRSLIMQFYVWAPPTVLLIFLSGNDGFPGLLGTGLILIFFFGISALNFPTLFYRFRYSAYLYLLLMGGFLSLLAIIALYKVNNQSVAIDRQRTAARLLVDNDVLGEYLLHEMSERIKTDVYIQRRILSPFSKKDFIEQKIRKVYLSAYFNQYDATVHVFNNLGIPVGNSYMQSPYAAFRSVYDSPNYRTGYPDIFFVNNIGVNLLKKYICFIDINRDGLNFGHIAVELNFKSTPPSRVYPELLVDRRFRVTDENTNYRYAIFNQSVPIFEYGDFNYTKHFNAELLSSSRLKNTGIIVASHRHVGITDRLGRTIVASAPVYPFRSLMANFSFLFAISVFFVLPWVAIRVGWWQFRINRLSMSALIQIYLNVSFALPMLLVSTVVVWLIANAYRNDQTLAYQRITQNILNNLKPSVELYINKNLSKEELFDKISETARLSDIDINLFDKSGTLMMTTQPAIYEKGLLSVFINPDAQLALLSRGDLISVLQERVGTLDFSVVYAGIKNERTRNFDAFISVPVFDSGETLEKRIVLVLEFILNIFTLLFILLTGLSVLAARRLVTPLAVIAKKLRRTTLEHNEPLEWKRNDEIGRLVKEYNNMIIALDHNRKALAQKQKESVWREMARQVAHEIKNPLTPIRLRLQKLERDLGSGTPPPPDKLRATFEAIIAQVDTLGDIATSFSAFAQMPTPENQVVDITAILFELQNLYDTDRQAAIEWVYPKIPIYIIADRRLTQQIINNLIINSFQAIPEGRQPKITIKLETLPNAQRTRLAVTDNGIGIEPAIQHKIFVPNFSTKTTGSGIGLAMAKRGIEFAGGSIWFDTTPKQGTTFYCEWFNAPAPSS